MVLEGVNQLVDQDGADLVRRDPIGEVEGLVLRDVKAEDIAGELLGALTPPIDAGVQQAKPCVKPREAVTLFLGDFPVGRFQEIIAEPHLVLEGFSNGPPDSQAPHPAHFRQNPIHVVKKVLFFISAQLVLDGEILGGLGLEAVAGVALRIECPCRF